jgi:SsrA-binding protein
MKIFNRKAKFNYHILEPFEAGIVLSGLEVKSLRLGRADLSDSFARVQNGEVFLKNLFIPPYQGGAGREYNPKQDRKLLLHKNQINNLVGKLSKGGMALIPLSIYSTRNMFKVELAIGMSKRQFDKRKVIKARDEQRKIEQELT